MSAPTIHADATAAPKAGSVRLYSRAQVRTALDEGVNVTADEAGIDPYDDRFTWAAAAAITLLDEPGAPWAVVKNWHYTGATERPRDDDEVPLFTRDQVSQAVNNGVDLASERQRHEVADDLDNFLVNAALTLLDEPDADFAQIVEDSYGEDPSTVRSWLS
ncbi:hypothetical protein [Streptomyces sp. BH055]|uniref:hypothetical protein n=1 Tax=unclassified Streptomyces TaxID=2593676 RepID=UPI003BB69E59